MKLYNITSTFGNYPITEDPGQTWVSEPLARSVLEDDLRQALATPTASAEAHEPKLESLTNDADQV